jgi:integrase
MRPLKQGLLSFPSHIFVRNGIYYYRTDIPTDLKHYFNTTEIKQSLKTKETKLAKVMAISLEYKVQQTYCLIRSGMLPDDVVQGIIGELQQCKTPTTSGELLSGLVADYVKVHESKWTYKTKLEVMGCLKLVVDVMEDLEVKKINRQTVLDFRAKLMKLPANMYKIYPDKSIQAILDMPDVEPMSVNSVNKHIMRLNALLGYAVKEGIVAVSYAQGIMLSDNRRNDELRKVYTVEDLKSIIGNLPREQERQERFWIPMIAMYSGLRLDEICQLYTEDVQQVDDVWCFNINDEKDKKLKNAASKRVVPIHPVLISCGLIIFVESMQKSSVSRLWMNLSWREADGYSNSMGSWYRRFNREHISKDKGKVFHSFRHTFTDSLKQAGVSETLIVELVGHSTSGSMTMGRYGKRYQPKVLLEALMQLDYGIDVELKCPIEISVPGHTTVIA